MINSRDINDLHPVVQKLAIELKKRMKEKGFDMGISSTYRDFEYQDYLYAQGRTRSGNIVTNCKSGQSIHNYRLAFDIFQNIKGKEYDPSFMRLAGSIGMELGLEWGGSWEKFIDTPHFEWTGGLTYKDLQNGKKAPNEKTFPWEKKTENVSKLEVDEMVDQTKIKINGKEYTVNRILKDGRNFVELQSYTQAGIKVDYDASKKMPILEFPKG